jgi:CxxC motif-containing protein (DUF1111 family)
MKLSKVLAFVILSSLFVIPLLMTATESSTRARDDAREAPAGFDDETNGYISQKSFDDFRATFNEIEEVEDGLGPVFNDTGCGNCHNIPVAGGSSDTLETRAGRLVNGVFIDHPGGSLVHDQAISPDIVERLQPGEDRTFRSSLNVLGDGFVEAIADQTIIDIYKGQPSDVRGMLIYVPVLEAGGTSRVARFGWKNQHASLESFAADAYLNEMGITSPLQRFENTSDGRDVSKYDTVPDPEDNGDDIQQFVDFMRATKVPPRGTISTADDKAGQALFEKTGCASCHVPTIATAPVGTSINGGTFRVPPALGDKVIHPYSDFLLHDIGTGDPIVQNGGQGTYDKVRTPPLWGLRTRNLLLHDGKSKTISDAIRRHEGQAEKAYSAYKSLSPQEREQLLTFLESL